MRDPIGNKKVRNSLAIFLIVTLICGMGLGLLWTQSVYAAFPGCNGKIVFLRDVGAATPNREVFVMNSNGGGVQRLTNSPDDDLQPDWSPDGTKIAFSSLRAGNVQIFVMNADGSNPQKLTSVSQNTHPAWSPNGTKIAFGRWDGDDDIWVMNADGSDQTQLVFNDFRDIHSAWSPDGTKIAFTSDRDGNREIWIMNAADGSNPQQLTFTTGETNGHPAWSPDGTKIAYSNNPGTPDVYNIWVMNADGSNPTQLTFTTSDSVNPDWSPDATKIVFWSERDNPGIVRSIWIINPDGSDQMRISLNADGIDWFPDWQTIPCGPVGGVVASTNKLAVLVPYLALAGLAGIVIAFVSIKNNRKD